MEPVFEIDSDDSYYFTSLLLHPLKNILFLGTSDGQVQVWDIDKEKQVAILRYLLIDEFGEQYPLQEPVMGLAAPDSFDLVYAFMGKAAYCIDVELLTIIQEIPISEQVVSGNVSPFRGEISVITEPGYLSRWSPRFVQNLSSVEFPYKTPKVYICHDFDEDRVILVFPNGNLLITNLGDRQYTINLTFQRATGLIDGIWYDQNRELKVAIKEDDIVQIFNHNYSDVIPDDHILAKGKEKAEDEIRNFVAKSNTSEDNRNYIPDFRLSRESRDRYVAATEQVDETGITISAIEDSKTVMYAIQDYNSGNYEDKAKASGVIEKIAARNQVSPRYIFFSYRQNKDETQIINDARSYQEMAQIRQNRIKYLIPIVLVLSLILLIYAETIKFTRISASIFAILFLTNLGLQIYWFLLNKNPEIPGIKSYYAILIFSLISTIFSGILMLII